LSLNLYDIVYELKQNIIDNIKRMDSIDKYKIEISKDYFYNFENSYYINYINSNDKCNNDCSLYTDRKNYTDMVIEARKIINIVIKNNRRSEIPYQLTDEYDL